MVVSAFAGTVRHYGSPVRANASGAYDWQRLHAAAIDRSFITRSPFARPRSPADQASKRVFDFTIAALLLIAISPILAIIALLARLDGGPALFGHRRIGTAGETFDPHLHEAVAYEPRPGYEEGQIATVVRPGYRLGERVIRPAQVTVARGG